MTLALFEARRLARSPVLWLGVVLVATPAIIETRTLWPMLEGDDMTAHGVGLWLSGFATLAGGWLGLRDRRTGTESLVNVTPAHGRAAIVPARVGALVAASFGAFAALFAAVLAASALRGGRGTPDLRLYLDGSLVVALGACVGYVVGYFTRSRIVCLLMGPGLPALSVWLQSPEQVRWLLPIAADQYQASRSVTYGFLPDVWSVHGAWLAGLVSIVAGGVVLFAARGVGARRTLIASSVVVLIGCVLAVPAGAWLRNQPIGVAVLGPDTAFEIHDFSAYNGFRKLDRLARAAGPWPDDGRATVCATRYGFEACVYPEFGEAYARRLASLLGPQARLLSGLDGVPLRARMVPSQWMAQPCAVGEVLYAESRYPPSVDGYVFGLLDCVWSTPYGGRGWRARAAVGTWLGVRAYPSVRAQLESGRLSFGGPGVTRTGLAMAEMPPDAVRAGLEPLWDRLRRGTLPLRALPGAPR
jgi:hypothetical protein